MADAAAATVQAIVHRLQEAKVLFDSQRATAGSRPVRAVTLLQLLLAHHAPDDACTGQQGYRRRG